MLKCMPFIQKIIIQNVLAFRRRLIRKIRVIILELDITPKSRTVKKDINEKRLLEDHENRYYMKP